MIIQYGLVKIAQNFAVNPVVTTGRRQDPYFGRTEGLEIDEKLTPEQKINQNNESCRVTHQTLGSIPEKKNINLRWEMVKK